jgi:hypothetical protein
MNRFLFRNSQASQAYVCSHLERLLPRYRKRQTMCAEECNCTLSRVSEEREQFKDPCAVAIQSPKQPNIHLEVSDVVIRQLLLDVSDSAERLVRTLWVSNQKTKTSVVHGRVGSGLVLPVDLTHRFDQTEVAMDTALLLEDAVVGEAVGCVGSVVHRASRWRHASDGLVLGRVEHLCVEHGGLGGVPLVGGIEIAMDNLLDKPASCDAHLGRGRGGWTGTAETEDQVHGRIFLDVVMVERILVYGHVSIVPYEVCEDKTHPPAAFLRRSSACRE